MENKPTQSMQLTSTTAPGKTFASRSELADHYKSDWHKYNLKRREMNMVMLNFEAFNARLEAALALKKERESLDERSGKNHLKGDKKNKKKSDKKKDHGETQSGRHMSKRHLRQEERKGGTMTQNVTEGPEQNSEADDNMLNTDDQEEMEYVDDVPPVIDPTQSLFDKQINNTVEENVEYMYKKYGFFIPDREYLTDLEGLVGYCAEKIKLGHMCLYCQKMFTSWRGCQEHMIHTRHTKLKYEAGIDLEEFDVFYDFTATDVEFLNSGIGNYKKKITRQNGDAAMNVAAQQFENTDEGASDDDSGEWEDIDSGEEMDEAGDVDQGLYAAYEDEIAKHGLDVTPLGEIVFPDGRIIGHRGLSRYYKQRITLQDSRPSVVAARRANDECLIEGRVYSTYRDENNEGVEGRNSLALARAGLSIGLIKGRQGNGILVPANGSSSGGTSFTAVSLYRYKAAMKKARKEEFQARRLEQRTALPMNKMDKKGNRLKNNVSVAHAPR